VVYCKGIRKQYSNNNGGSDMIKLQHDIRKTTAYDYRTISLPAGEVFSK